MQSCLLATEGDWLQALAGGAGAAAVIGFTPLRKAISQTTNVGIAFGAPASLSRAAARGCKSLTIFESALNFLKLGERVFIAPLAHGAAPAVLWLLA
jgi:hypothetical protein